MPLDLETGARNLLLQCAEAKTGDRLLLVGEDSRTAFFDPRLCDDVATIANELGIRTEVLLTEPGSSANQFPTEVNEAMQDADITIFFSRLGDQIRFAKSPGNGKKIMTYTLSREHLGSAFATTDYRMMKAIHDRLLADICNATQYSIKSANGTDLSAELPASSNDGADTVSEFSLDLFPVMIFPPVNFSALNGRLVMEHFLLSSSTRAYEDSIMKLDSPVIATIEDSHIIAFEGDTVVIDRLRAQLTRAASITDGDPYRLNSWHTGINPYTFFDGDPYDDLERWGTVAYGSPRYTHIHAAGHDPGDISIQLFDASISFDDKIYWDQGRFVFLDQPETQTLLSQSSQQPPDSSTRLSIGM